MSSEQTEQKKRTQEIADKIRTYLAALNTGGIVIAFGVAGSLANQKVNPLWAAWPVVYFVAGLLILGASLFLAKHKALKRRHNPQINFTKWYWRNFVYDFFSLTAFVVAVYLGLWQLSCLRLS